MQSTLVRALTAWGRGAALLVCVALSVLFSGAAHAAPEARLLRVDPRAAQENGNPILTTVVDVTQSKRISDAAAPCATLTGNAQLDCMSQSLEKPLALYTPFPFPAQAAIFTVTVDDTDVPAKYLSHSQWGESQQQPGVGTAWLVLVDADRRMGKGFDDAKQIAQQFITSLGPNDIINIMFFNDRQIVKDSRWMAASQRARAQQFVQSVGDTFASGSRNRSLLTIIKNAATDGFKALGNVGEEVKMPLHQAMVVLSSGFGGADPSTTGPGALQLQQYLSGGRFPEDNTALPKAPVPVISIYFPHQTFQEFSLNSLEFMQNLANTELGGFFTVVQQGGGARAATIVNAVRQRFSKMFIVKWRVSCVAPSITQSFKLVFNNVNPPILGDNSFKDVPVGIDPSTWPLDVNVEYTADAAKRQGGVYPSGTVKVFGDFCWGGDKSRAEVYFLPAGQQIPTALAGADLDKAKRTQQQLIAMGMKGTALEASDTFATFEAPDKDKILHGSGDQAVVRLVIYDNRAHRTSGVTADSILQLKGTTAPLPLLLILGSLLGVVVLALLVVIVLKSGGKKRGGGQNAPLAPVMAGGGAPYAAPAPYAPSPGPAPYAPPAGGGYGAPAPAAAPMGYGAAASPTCAVLQGAPGTFTLLNGQELKAGRDPNQCGIVIHEPRISGVHATLKLENGQLLVRDENSNNGTLINNVRLSPSVWSPVPSGSLLRLGPVELSVRLQ
ncbi:MAG TPA: FHA domain-containing protein [Polyangiaceae bacterium]|nr:FHA domain-containing protein [Polyangiaceae bacterium]